MNCDCKPCCEQVYADVQWVTEDLGTQTATLCKLHVDELAEKLCHLVMASMASFRIDLPGKIKAEIAEDKGGKTDGFNGQG